jgi:hypothetical protein
MHLIKHSASGHVLTCTSTQVVTAETKLVYASFYAAEHDAMNTLLHVHDNITAVCAEEVTFEGDSLVFKVGMHRYVLTLKAVGETEEISHAFSISKAVEHDRGQWPQA